MVDNPDDRIELMSIAPASNIAISSARPASLFTRLQRLWARRETIWFLTTSQLRAGHRDKVLGQFWSILDPLMYLVVYYFVFSVLLKLGGDDRGHFLAYLFIGITNWRFFDSVIGQSATTIRGNRGLIHEINFPKAIFPIAICLARFYDLMLGIVAMLVVIVIAQYSGGGMRIPLSANLLWVPFLLLLQLVFIAGLAFFVAHLGAFYADTANIVTIAIRLLFYISPIFYYVRGPHARITNPDLLKYYMLNPVAGFLEGHRDVLLEGRMPHYLPYLVFVSLLSFVVGFAIFSRGEKDFVKYV
ncbi:MAG: ABC transporter permease [Phycisphaerae bacterium]